MIGSLLIKKTISEEELLQKMNKSFGKCNEECNNLIWKTIYGVTFSLQMANNIKMVAFKYDHTQLLYCEKSDDINGVIEYDEMKKLIGVLKKNPLLLYDKTPSIKIIEENTYLNAVRDHMIFGSWHLYNHDETISLFNNPFKLYTGYTNDEDNFEFMIKGNEPEKYVQLYTILYKLNQLGYSRHKHCFVCQKDDAKRCIGCKYIRYCNKKCQQSDWIRHKKDCKKNT